MLRNLGSNYVCRQSSSDISQFSLENEIRNVLDGPKNGHFAFHTMAGDSSPWWQVDFGRSMPLEALVVFNREKYRERATSLQAWMSDDGQAWEKFFDNKNIAEGERIFGGVYTGPRTVWMPGLSARFVRLTADKGHILHLDGVVFYQSVDDCNASLLAEVVRQVDGGADEVGRVNLTRSNVNFAEIEDFVERNGPFSKKVGLTFIRYLADCGLDIAEGFPEKLGLGSIEDGYAAMVRGYISSDLDRARKAYRNLVNFSPDYSGLLELHEMLLAASGGGERGDYQTDYLGSGRYPLGRHACRRRRCQSFRASA
ncbi:F5/8 type C domain-containing protein [Humitalea rosea]|uniref:F5/8 type C domain-containing protein n=1 Tax=Humitalea rosea TaxID=990373 RepID=A0A2W7IRW1_9PROT|nr:discoidin domain-containing protein [Humitalea rosea]PZW50336.1 F5/8 type C domain-containing protein [Humitalea rosea]